ncbi:hypothetical protein BDW62DRAFT_195301 [Aspergillus aurantiobrunneus]
MSATSYSLSCSIILVSQTMTPNDDRDVDSGSIVKDEQDFCALKEPSNKWALVKSNSMQNELTLNQLLGIIQKEHRVYVFAYRRLPLTGEPMRATSDFGVLVKQTLYVREGVEWIFHKRLPFPCGVDRLIDLKGKARTHRAKFSVVLKSAITEEILEGEASISLTPRKRGRDETHITTGKKRGRPLKSEKAAKSNAVPETRATPGPNPH